MGQPLSEIAGGVGKAAGGVIHAGETGIDKAFKAIDPYVQHFGDSDIVQKGFPALVMYLLGQGAAGAMGGGAGAAGESAGGGAAAGEGSGAAAGGTGATAASSTPSTFTGDLGTTDIGTGTAASGSTAGTAAGTAGAGTSGTVEWPQPFSQPDSTPTIEQSKLAGMGPQFGNLAAQALNINGMPFAGQGAAGAAPAAAGTPPSSTTTPPAPTAPTSPTSPGAGTAPTSTGDSMVDKILAQMKNNPLATAGLAMTALPLFAGRPQVPQATRQQGELGANAKATSDQLLAQYRSGQLSATQQASIDQVTQQTKAQLAQYFASIGQSDSTAAKQAMAQVDQQAMQMKQQMLDTALQQGLNAIGVASGPLQNVAQTQIGQDRALTQAFGNFASQLGNFAGQKAATTPTTPSTVAPTIQSNS